MTMVGSGPISINDIAVEFGAGATPYPINEYFRGGARVANNVGQQSIPVSPGPISFSQFYGTHNTGDASANNTYAGASSTRVVPLEYNTITIRLWGGGGGGGRTSAGTNSTKGGDSSISGAGLTAMTARGGAIGVNQDGTANARAGGAGGTATGGNVNNITGDAGVGPAGTSGGKGGNGAAQGATGSTGSGAGGVGGTFVLNQGGTGANGTLEGGAGGGMGSIAATISGSSGGGGGGYASTVLNYPAITPGGTLSFTIGAGGTGGNSSFAPGTQKAGNGGRGGLSIIYT